MPEEKLVSDYDLRKEKWIEESRAPLLLQNAPSISPEQPYMFENGTLYVPPAIEPAPFIPDRGFDGPA